MQEALQYVNAHLDRFVNELEDLLRIPSVSTDPSHSEEVTQCAQWLAQHFRDLGMAKAHVHETDGHPIVYAEHTSKPSAPTVLVYGHYDVQPPDPLELWNSAPFEPERKEGALFARGACDDKGQLFMHLKAVEAHLQSGAGLPVNVKFIIEGEEETGSTHLPSFIKNHKQLLDADVVTISDTAMFAPGVPSITYGLRGLAYVEVVLVGPNRDLHSGVYGGGVENPANTLSRLISGLHDADHRINVSGFYDDAQDLTEEEHATYRKLPFNENKWKEAVGVDQVRTETGYSLLEAITARPTLDVNGLWSGYQGEGAKTVLPAKAGAKISARLVPDQRPDDIAHKLQSYFEDHLPETMKLDFRDLHGGRPVLVDRSHPAMQAASEAMESVYDRKVFFTREGGTIPVVADFKEQLGLESVLMGFGLNSDAIHSPNEHFGLDRFDQGIRSVIRFHQNYGNV